MNSIADEYENWFRDGDRDLSEFVSQRESSGSPLDSQQFRDCLLTDQYLRHQRGQSVDVAQYTNQFEQVAKSEELQIELWLEAYGYLEDTGPPSRDARDSFLAGIPDPIRAAITNEIEVGETLPLPDRSDSAAPIAQQSGPPRIDRYQIEEEIGHGSFGTVYRGWDSQLERAVAIKVLRTDMPSDSLVAEARVVANLETQGIVSIYDCGIDKDGRAFLVTSFVDGPDLREWLGSIDRNDHQRICKLFIRLCHSMAKAHQAGIVHRDIKPTNIIVQEGDEPVLLDFGLATRNWQPGRKGELVGTPAYMSPEQARGEGHLVDARSDIFSTGILLLESLAERLPWESGSSREMIREIAHGQVRSARQFNAKIPIELDRICNKATASSMSARYSNAVEFAADLEWFVGQKAGAHSSDMRSGTIGPRGLQPYGPDDAEAFWQLLPGQRNGKGEPDCVRWWLDQLQNQKGTSRPVLTLYGPSGSGKSSLLSAGVIPFLDRSESRAVEIDASELREHNALAMQLKNWLPDLNEKLGSLAEQFAEIRNRDSRNKTIVVFDQFEQIFRSGFEDQREKLFLAMRQADGQRLQFVLVVRDEFWSAISQWMRRLETPLRDGRNAMALERFSRSHATDVLKVWADSIQVSSNDAFVAKAVDLLVDGERVIPVRLALLAKILGEEGWTDQRLEKIASYSSLSGYYLDSVLGDLAPAAQRKLIGPAKEVLRSLVPATGQIRGHAKSLEELKTECQSAGLRVTSEDFDDLIDLLERKLHLLTPVESENDDATSTGNQYQLPHDFLVPEIRRWLNTTDRQSVAGRANMDLQLATSRWNADQRSGNLAGPIDCLRFGIFAQNARKGESNEREFLKTSARKHLLRGVLAAFVAAGLFVFFHGALNRSHGNEIVERLLSSSVDELPPVVVETRRNRYWTEKPLTVALGESTGTSGNEQRDRIALALLEDDLEQASYLADRLAVMDPQANLVFAKQIRMDLEEQDRQNVANHLASVASDESQSGEERLKAAIAIGILDPEHSFWEQYSEQASQLLVDANPTDLGWLAEGLHPVREKLLSALSRSRGNRDATRARTATYLLAEFAADDPVALVDLVEKSSTVHLGPIFSTIADVQEGEFDEHLLNRFTAAAKSWKEGPKTADDSSRKARSSNSPSVIHARSAGNLGAALLLRGNSQPVVKHLKHQSDPTFRSYLIHCYASGNGPARPLVDLLVDDEGDALAEDSNVLSALIQMIGNLPASSKIPSSVRKLANKLCRTSEDAELSATAKWFLKRHGYDDDIKDAELPKAIGYQTSEGHTMVRLPGGVRVAVGATDSDGNRLPNEKQHEIEIPKEIYFSRNELTMEQLVRFLVSVEGADAPIIKGHTRTPEVRMGFFIAAAYCNWLSEKEGIPKDQWCYLPGRNGEIGPGMKIASDHLERSGYQIPTPDLWEYACRGDATTPRPFGFGLELSSPYVRWSGTRDSYSARSAARLPNAFGLVDMLGNRAEWSVGLVDGKMNGPNRMSDFEAFQREFGFSDDRPNGPLPNRRPPPGRFRTGQPGLAFGGGPTLIDSAGKTIERHNQFAILGGAYDSPAHKIRSSDRSMISPAMTNKPVTLRLMRIVPEDQK